MSKLASYTRPVVLFDPSNRIHRHYATEFVATRTWKNCPVRFTVADDHGDLIGYIQRELILWYSRRERKVNSEIVDSQNRRKKLGLTQAGLEIKM